MVFHIEMIILHVEELSHFKSSWLLKGRYKIGSGQLVEIGEERGGLELLQKVSN